MTLRKRRRASCFAWTVRPHPTTAATVTPQQSTAKASCPRRSTYSQSAPCSVRFACSAEGPRGFASSFQSLRLPSAKLQNRTLWELPPFLPFVKTLHASALLRCAPPFLTSDGHCPRALRSLRTIKYLSNAYLSIIIRFHALPVL